MQDVAPCNQTNNKLHNRVKIHLFSGPQLREVSGGRLSPSLAAILLPLTFSDLLITFVFLRPRDILPFPFKNVFAPSWYVSNCGPVNFINSLNSVSPVEVITTTGIELFNLSSAG